MGLFFLPGGEPEVFGLERGKGKGLTDGLCSLNIHADRERRNLPAPTNCTTPVLSSLPSLLFLLSYTCQRTRIHAHHKFDTLNYREAFPHLWTPPLTTTTTYGSINSVSHISITMHGNLLCTINRTCPNHCCHISG